MSSHEFYLNGNVTCDFIKYGGYSTFSNNIFWLQVFQLFGMLWLANLVLALEQCTLAGAFSSYYWAKRKPEDIPSCPVATGFARAIAFHVGSLAFGSLIIAIVQIIRITLEYINHKLKDKENDFAKFLMKCLRCCFWCLQKFLEFLNTNAYILIAIHGKNFCWSAKEAFKLIGRNIIRVIVIDKIADFIIFIGKVVVVTGVTALAWAFFTDQFPSVIELKSPTLHYYWMPIFITVGTSYFIASGFFKIFSMAIDTIFLCFLDDLEINDGTSARPYRMTKDLRVLLHKNNTATSNTISEGYRNLSMDDTA